ncbi:MAG: Hsp20 family protein [Bacteriovorax sp.]|jgi:HSP20 family molecular chaperone IbpA
MFKFFILIFTLIASSFVFAQTRQDDMQRQIEEVLKARDEMIKSLLNDQGFQNFDKRFEDMLRNFEKHNLGGDSNTEGAVIGEYDWRETDTLQIFVLKVKQMKDRPLDIKIEKGNIKLKGDVETINEDKTRKSKSVSKVHFERTFSIPAGVDQTTPEFENKAGELLIKFKKLVGQSPKFKKQKIIPPSEDRRPLVPDADDITI